jgi:hypothetical protein
MECQWLFPQSWVLDILSPRWSFKLAAHLLKSKCSRKVISEKVNGMQLYKIVETTSTLPRN